MLNSNFSTKKYDENNLLTSESADPNNLLLALKNKQYLRVKEFFAKLHAEEDLETLCSLINQSSSELMDILLQAADAGSLHNNDFLAVVDVVLHNLSRDAVSHSILLSFHGKMIAALQNYQSQVELLSIKVKKLLSVVELIAATSNQALIRHHEQTPLKVPPPTKSLYATCLLRFKQNQTGETTTTLFEECLLKAEDHKESESSSFYDVCAEKAENARLEARLRFDASVSTAEVASLNGMLSELGLIEEEMCSSTSITKTLLMSCHHNLKAFLGENCCKHEQEYQQKVSYLRTLR
jgi:hypothetical protein